MKKINLVLACGVIFTLASSINLSAQDGKDFALTNASGTKQTVNLSFPENAHSTKIINDKKDVKELKARLREAKANNKVTGYVNNHFKDVSDLQIFGATATSELILAKFTMYKKSARAVYDKKGNWLYTIINYQEDDLPGNVKSLVNSRFKEYSITLVQEISEGDITFYKVFLENCRNAKQVLVYNDEVTVFLDYVKQ
jgi:hypothetical protein